METTKKYPAGTTKEQWDQYEIKKAKHELYCEGRKPVEEHFSDLSAYMNAMRNWEAMKFMDAPNKPGYHRANND